MEPLLTAAILGLCFALLAFGRSSVDLTLMGGLTLLILFGIVPVEKALVGFSNPGLVAIGALFVVARGLVQTKVAAWMGQKLLGEGSGTRTALWRMLPGVTLASALMNNTPLVAMLVPGIQRWSERHQISSSKLLMPLSFAAILGGTCSLMGTSTNLLLDGMMRTHGALEPMGLFEIAWVGLPVAVIGVFYLVLIAPSRLEDRSTPFSASTREYILELLITETSPVVGKSIEEAGLRNLQGGFVAEIQRGESLMPAVSPREVLAAGDRLIFVGDPHPMLERAPSLGLAPASDHTFDIESPRPLRRLVEVVVSATHPLIGQRLREGRFRSRYGAVVLAASREGQALRGRLGDQELRPGDNLLLEARPSFLEQNQPGGDFLLITERRSGPETPSPKALWAVLILLGLVVTVATGLLDIFRASILAAGLMTLSRCLTAVEARRSVDISILLAIAAALGLSEAVVSSGLAELISTQWIGWTGQHPMAVLGSIYALTLLLTLLLTNNAAAALAFPVALSLAHGSELDPRPLIMTIAMAASASFATPIAYQTNLMVMGPGGYRFMDFWKVGFPLTLVHAALTLTLTPLIWPL